jgi:hypothetical protein
MAIADPKHYTTEKPKDAPVAEPTLAAVMLQMTSLLQEMRNAQSDEQRAAAIKQAEMIEQVLVKTKPENTEHPGISVYSYPEGDKAHPKPPLRCTTTICGHQFKKDAVETLTPTEVELLNRLDAGTYHVTKADGSRMKLAVEFVRNSEGGLQEMRINWPCKNEHRHNHLSMASYLQQAIDGAIPSHDEMLSEIHRLKMELASRSVIGTV